MATTRNSDIVYEVVAFCKMLHCNGDCEKGFSDDSAAMNKCGVNIQLKLMFIINIQHHQEKPKLHILPYFAQFCQICHTHDIMTQFWHFGHFWAHSAAMSQTLFTLTHLHNI